LKESTPAILRLIKQAQFASECVSGEDDDLEQDLRRVLAKYERQPRHKTRADKYEPKTKETATKSHHVKGMRQSKQPHAAMKLDFKAPNVSQNRLTVREVYALEIFLLDTLH
jgi:hypothetical protein